MTKINFEQAREFLENITEKDRVAIITHDDLDGFASGILLAQWCEKQGAEWKNFIFGYGKWNNIDFKRFNKILITDIAPGGISEIKLPQDKEIFYTDHHPEKEKIPENIKEYRTSNEGYIPSSRTCQELTQLNPLLGLAGTIADAGHCYPNNKEYIQINLEKLNLSLEEFQKQIVNVISNTILFLSKDLQKVFELIYEIKNIKDIHKLKEYSEPIENELKEQEEKINKGIEKIGPINFAYLEPKFPIKRILITKMSMKNPKEPFIFMSPEESNHELLGISSRHQSDKANLPEILKFATSGLENSNFGGHLRAAGGQILKKDLQKFKDNLREYVKQHS